MNQTHQRETLKAMNVVNSDTFHMIKFLVFIFFIATFCIPVFSQEEKNLLVDGNKMYSKGDFTSASDKYKKSLDKRKNYTKASYNLGNAIYRTQKFEDAATQFDATINLTNNKDTLSKIYHNLGNSYLKSKKYQEAVNAYKNSMKLNSFDEDTRYNLAYALKKLDEQKKKDQQNKKDQHDQKNEKDQQNQKDQSQQNNQNKISKEQAEQMLKALIQNEKKIQEDKKKKEKNAKKAEVEKDW